MADSTIGALTNLTDIQDDDLFLLEHNGVAGNLKGSDLKDYAQSVVAKIYVGSSAPTDESINVWADNSGGGDVSDIVKDVQINGTSIVASNVANITVDSALSSTSTNPVQNKVVSQIKETFTKSISELNKDIAHVKDMTSLEEQSGTYAGYHLGFYLDANGDLCQKD